MTNIFIRCSSPDLFAAGVKEIRRVYCTGAATVLLFILMSSPLGIEVKILRRRLKWKARSAGRRKRHNIHYKILKNVTIDLFFRKFVGMSIYSLKQGYYLYHDVEFVLDQIGELYKVDVQDSKVTATSIMELDKKNHFASLESKERFNAIIPKIKALHTSMYHLLECIYRATDNQVFNIDAIENQFPDFRYFRLLNNKIKHLNEADIDLIEVVLMDGTKSIIDVGCKYKIGESWEIKYYAQFIVLVLEILKERNIVSFNSD